MQVGLEVVEFKVWQENYFVLVVQVVGFMKFILVQFVEDRKEIEY